MVKARCLFIRFGKRLQSAFANNGLEKFKKTKTFECTQVQMTASLTWLIETSQIKFIMKARCSFIDFRKRLKSAFAIESLEIFKKTETLERTGRNEGGAKISFKKSQQLPQNGTLN